MAFCLALLVLMRMAAIYGDFPNSFAMKVHAGPYRPYDN